MDREVTEIRHITRLMYDCSWKTTVDFKCNVCNCHMVSYTNKDTYSDKWHETHDKMIAHITTKHQTYCYGCNKCGAMFITKKEHAMHRKTCK